MGRYPKFDLFAFTAGAIDAAVGGGGLIQIPGIMSTFPNMSTATVIGTNKVSSIFGTASAAYTFAKKSKIAVEAFSSYCHLCSD